MALRGKEGADVYPFLIDWVRKVSNTDGSSGSKGYPERSKSGC